MSYDFPGHAALSLLMAVALLTIMTSIAAMYMLLVQIELQATLTFDDAEEDVELEENPENDDGYVNASNVVNKGAIDKETASDASVQVEEETGPARRLRLPNYRRAALAGIVAIVTFMSYLLLAVSNANFILQWIGMAIILGILMRPTIFEELRRDRYDRLASLMSLLLVLAMALNLMVYANDQHAQGDIYEGKARIIGYDYESYSQEKDDKILRTDLEVAWGGDWGCPNVPDQACTAYVSGALCETEEKNRRKLVSMKKRLPQSRRQTPRNRRSGLLEKPFSNRRLDDQNIEQVVDEEQADDTEDTSTASNEGGEDSKTYEELEKENEELQQENNDLEAENADLTEQLAADEETIDEYEQYAYDEDEIIEELDEEITVYYFDDDYYYDEYWGETEWNDVWGEYACEDLFDSDMNGESFDASIPPGDDDWPFINVYGNCNTCEAYMVDYYSTQHFQSILKYKNAGLVYGLLAGCSLIVTGYLIVKEVEKKRRTEKEIELLSTPAAAASSIA